MYIMCATLPSCLCQKRNAGYALKLDALMQAAFLKKTIFIFKSARTVYPAARIRK